MVSLAIPGRRMNDLKIAARLDNENAKNFLKGQGISW